MKTIPLKLQSGRELKITLGSFGEGEDLWIALNKEFRSVNFGSHVELDTNLVKEIFCMANSSREINACLKPLLKRCLYNNDPIDDQTFEDIEAREDYLEICEMVAKENILPFAKGLLRKYGAVIQQLKLIFLRLSQERNEISSTSDSQKQDTGTSSKSKTSGRAKKS